MKKKIVVRVLSGTLALVSGIVITGGILKLNKDKSKEFNIPPDSITTSMVDVETDNYEDISLEDMNTMFYKNIAKFDTDIQKYLIEIYNGLISNIGLYKNYMDFSGYPNVLSFINQKFVEPLGSISFIKEIKESNPKYNELIDKYCSSCYEASENGIYLFDSFDIDDFEKKLILAEEVVHAGQSDLDKFINYGDYLILGEGEANIIAAMQNDTINTKNINYFFDHNNFNNVCELHGISHRQNIMATRYYTYLTVLVGYENVFKWRETGDSKIIEDTISQKYGIDGSKLYNDMFESIINCYNGEYFNDASKMFEVENEFLYCFNMIVQNVKNEKNARQILELYRYLNIQYGIKYEVFNDEQTESKDVTGNFIDKSEVENNLFNMINNYNICYISGVNPMNRNIFNAYINPKIDRYRDLIPVLYDNIKYDNKSNSLIIGDGKLIIPVLDDESLYKSKV